MLFYSSLIYSQEEPQLVVSKGHHQNINSVDISPDDKYIASGASDNQVKVYDLKKRQELFSYGNHADKVNHVLFSPDGKYLVSVSELDVLVYNHPEGSLHKKIPIRLTGQRLNLHITKDNEALIGTSGGVKVYSLETGEMTRHIEEIKTHRFVLYDNERKLIGTCDDCSADSTGIGIYDITSGKRVDLILLPELYYENYAITKDESTLVVEKSSGYVVVYDLKTKAIRWEKKVENGILNIMKVTPDGKQMVSAGWNNVVKFWDLENGKLLREISDLTPEEGPMSMSMGITDMDFSKKGDLVAFCYADLKNGSQWYTVEWFNYKSMKSVGSHAGDVKFSLSISMDHSGTVLTTGLMSSNPGVRSMSLKDGNNKGFVPGAAFHGSGGEFMVAFNKHNYNNPTMDVYRMPDHQLYRAFPIYGFANTSMSNSGKYAVALDQKPNYVDSLTVTGITPYIRIWDVESGVEKVHIEKSLMEMPISCTFNDDESKAIIIYTTKFEVIDVETGSVVGSYNQVFNRQREVPVAPNSSLLLDGFKNIIFGIDFETGDKKEIFTIGENRIVFGISFSRDRKLLAVPCFDYSEDSPHRILVFDWETKQLLYNVKGESNFIREVVFSPDNKNLIYVDDNGIISLWDLAKNEVKCKFLSDNAKDMIIVTPKGYYKSTKGNIPNVAFRQKGSLYSFDQFDLRYNRPDIVIRQLGLAAEKLIDIYYKAYLKRLKRTGFNESMLSNDFILPEISIVNGKSIPLETMESQLILDLLATDSVHKLDRINVWVNDVPVYGVKGYSLRDDASQEFSKKVNLELGAGLNRIEVSTMNQAGVESVKERLIVNCKKPTRKPDLYLIVLGVSNYQDANFNLKYAVKDGRDLSELFGTNSTNWRNVYIDTLFNENVTVENVKALKKGLSTGSVDDELIFYISGHGVLDDQLDFYYAPYDMNFENASERGVSYETLEDLLDNIPHRKKILLMDACHGGEIDKENIVVSVDSTLLAVENTRGSIRSYSYRGVAVEESEEETDDAIDPFKIMQESFVDLDKRNGATVISASAGESFAFESDEWQNGVFTFALIDGLKNLRADSDRNKEVQIEELKAFLVEKVSELTEGAQVPNARLENAVNYRVW
jgi:WD40 repeat protein